MKYLIDNKIMVPMTDYPGLENGNIIRRVGNGKDQQGAFGGSDDSDGLILINVIDMANIAFAAEAGILKPSTGDEVYVFTTAFGANEASSRAREIIQRWPLYKKNPDLQEAIMNFIERSFAPEQLIDFERTDNLKFVFIPTQQKFRIGRFEEKTDWALEEKNRFREHLNGLEPGEHITYVAFMPPNKTYAPRFYSIGTKPHQTTLESLLGEPFSFKPNRGGHIKCLETGSEGSKFIVDAGSNFLGKGTATVLETAKEITDALGRLYRGHSYVPIEGRGAFGTEQSY